VGGSLLIEAVPTAPVGAFDRRGSDPATAKLKLI